MHHTPLLRTAILHTREVADFFPPLVVFVRIIPSLSSHSPSPLPLPSKTPPSFSKTVPDWKEAMFKAAGTYSKGLGKSRAKQFTNDVEVIMRPKRKAPVWWALFFFRVSSHHVSAVFVDTRCVAVNDEREVQRSVGVMELSRSLDVAQPSTLRTSNTFLCGVVDSLLRSMIRNERFAIQVCGWLVLFPGDRRRAEITIQ